MKPFLKWAGGKRRIAHIIADLMPGDSRRLIEPFVGGASVSLNINMESYLLADANEDLIATYNYLVNDTVQFVTDCQVMFDSTCNNKDKYYSLREEFNESSDPYRRACIFVYLNKHCFNGLIRFNSSGKFNTPFGRYTAPKFPYKEMMFFADKFKTTKFLVDDFRKTLLQASSGDFVYCDPPYTPLNDTGFVAYSKGGFSLKDHQHLVQCCIEAAAKGACVVVSNHDTPATRLLYSNATKMFDISVKRTISGSGDARVAAAELIAVYQGPGITYEQSSIFT